MKHHGIQQRSSKQDWALKTDDALLMQDDPIERHHGALVALIEKKNNNPYQYAFCQVQALGK